MLEPTSENTLTPSLSIDVRELRNRFEAACQAGDVPIIDDYLGNLVGAAREHIVGELKTIEQRYQALRTATATEMTVDLTSIPSAPAARPVVDPQVEESQCEATRSLPTRAAALEQTLTHSNESITPTGRLLIRCPHCANGVELLAETPFEDITCHDCGSTFNLVDREKLTTAAAAPKAIGRFKLDRKLGAGGFGSVWLALDSDLDRVVAIKIPRKGQLNALEMEQFYREARAAAQLRHPNIVPVHEVGRDGDTVFIVSDFIEGVSLSDWTHGRRIGPRVVAQLAATVADALDHAHKQGIIHRDLKPSNVMIDAVDQPHLMDFGLARREAGEVTMTVDGQILGTPTYMSPEQASGQSHWADRRTDIYSFGVMLFKLLTDELPFRGSIQRQIQQRLTDDAPDPRTLNRFIPRDLSTIVLKCLERDPNKRYSTAAAVAEELRRFLRGEPIVARPISKAARLARWAKRKPAAATAVVLALLLSIGGPLVAWRIERQRQNLAAMLAERNNIIKQSAVDAKRDGQEIERLNRELDVWNGKANPWKLWPPDASFHPRLTVLNKFYDDRYKAIAASLASGKYRESQTAAGHLALGLVSAKLDKQGKAEKHLVVAKVLLESLVASYPGDANYQMALAQCLTHLAQLYADDRRDEAAKLLAEAASIRKQLAANDQGNPEVKIDWLETELAGGVLAGFSQAGSHLNEAAAIEQSLIESWPEDPVAIYHFAAYLTGEQAADLKEAD